MTTLTEILAKLRAQTTVFNGIVEFIRVLRAESDPAARQAILDEIEIHNAIVAAAVAENTAAEGEPPAPVV